MKGRSAVEVLTGAGVLLVAALFLTYAVSRGGRGVQPEGMTLTAQFDRIDGLVNGADVRIAGVKVGSVADSSIDPASFNAVVTMRVDRSLRLPSDSSAEITSDGLLGRQVPVHRAGWGGPDAGGGGADHRDAGVGQPGEPAGTVHLLGYADDPGAAAGWAPPRRSRSWRDACAAAGWRPPAQPQAGATPVPAPATPR